MPSQPLNARSSNDDRLNLNARHENPLPTGIPLHRHHRRLLLLLIQNHLERDGIVRIRRLSTTDLQRHSVPAKDNAVRGIRALLLALHYKLLCLRVCDITLWQSDPPWRLKANIGQPLHLLAPYVVNSTRREGLVSDEANIAQLSRQLSRRIQRSVNPAVDEAASNRSGRRVLRRQNQLAADHLADARIPLDPLDNRQAPRHIHPFYTVSTQV